MFRRLFKKPGVALSVGLAMGLLVGVGMMIGALATAAWWSPQQGNLPETLLRASTAQSSDSFAIATGTIDANVEGVFLLDYITGDLQCWVLSPRSGQINGLFRYNVARDLATESGKSPKYLMATGRVTFLGGGPSSRFGNCAVYVVDANTGVVATYAVPWERTRANAGGGQMGTLVRLDVPMQHD